MIAHIIGLVCAASLMGCTETPSLDSATGVSPFDGDPQKNGVFVGDVVNRIKCELADAFAGKLETGNKLEDGTPIPTWLADWTVKADLTLQANEFGNITPSGSFTQFQKSAVNFAAGPSSFPGSVLGTFQQFFALTASANLGAQAVRTEVISFTLSLKELDIARRENPARFRQLCSESRERGLLGHLGLKEWVDAALLPVSGGELFAGRHPAPSTGMKQAQPQFVAKPQVTLTGISANGKTPSLTPPQRMQMLDLAFAAEQKAALARDQTVANFQTTRIVFKDVEQSFDQSQLAAGTYGPIGTAETQSKLLKQRHHFDTSWEGAHNARNCNLRLLCGVNYGGCSAFIAAVKCPPKDPVCHVADRDDANMQPLKPSDATAIDQCLASLKAPKCAHKGGAIGEAACASEDYEELKKDAKDAEDAENARDDKDSPDVKEAKEAKIAEIDIKFQQDADAVAAFQHDVEEDAADSKKLADFSNQLKVDNVSRPDPPIDSLGHSVQFLVSYGGAVTPSWTLISWRGPGLNAPMLSANGVRTQLLQLALASPSPTNTSEEQERLLQNQTVFLSHQ